MCAFAQDVIYITKLSTEAHRDIIYVTTEHQADICINVVPHQHHLRMYKNSWHYTKTRSNATIILREVTTTNGNKDAIKIYLYKTPRESISSKWLDSYKLLK